MAVYSLKKIQQIPVSVGEAWQFFSNPGNLQKITPPGMKFTVISKQQQATIYPGQIIEYRVRPLLDIPVYWMTEITHVEEGKLFVDEQRHGPYNFWHHQHHFSTVNGGVEMTDIVHYKLPLWFIGDLLNSLFVKKKLEEIFNYRRQQVALLLGEMINEPAG